ncbi:YoaH family protein [Serratia liquefaciens]|uniref:YoaH family protein n=1 Tax=Serratia liquefaciens TaxID=614 RepID=UPI000D51AEF3|nr:YoaH family protein [Serratia liquefaciens]PVD43875.1 YoaH family protein [Serratia liquefaciens]QHT51494.1 YoaH family protein [Serratia liquefaciens]
MLAGMPSLSHLEQQEAADRIHQLMEQGMSSGEAIARVAQEIREKHQGDQVSVMFDDEDDDEDEEYQERPEDQGDDDSEEDENY